MVTPGPARPPRLETSTLLRGTPARLAAALGAVGLLWAALAAGLA